MSKEKTPFEKTAAALKVMGKKIAAKKNEPRRELQCVWIANNSGHAAQFFQRKNFRCPLKRRCGSIF